MYTARAAPRSAMIWRQKATSRLSGPSSMRSLHLRPTASMASKKEDLMDRESMNPTSTEHSKTGGDQQVAQESEAFDPQTTRPESEYEQARNRSGGDSNNPLNMSGASKGANQGAQEAQRGGTGKSPSAAEGERKSSGGGSPRKDGSPAGR